MVTVHVLETVAEALSSARRQLAPSRTASLDAQLLLSHVLRHYSLAPSIPVVAGRGAPWVSGQPRQPTELSEDTTDRQILPNINRAWLSAHADAHIPPSVRHEFEKLVMQRAQGMPVAYLRGFVEWYDATWEVNPDVLIPRPETEFLLEQAIRLIEDRHIRHVVDLGTGSGILAVTLARLFLRLHVDAVDVSAEALVVARRNATSMGVADRVHFIQGNLIEAVPQMPDLVIANLPYLSNYHMGTLSPDVRFEPSLALDGGSDGTCLYRRMFEQMRDKHWSCSVLVEVDAQQPEELETISRACLRIAHTQVWNDYAGLPRVMLFDP